MEQIDLKGLTPAEIDRFCTIELGQRPGQGLRAAKLLFRERIEYFEAMSRLSRNFIAALKKQTKISTLPVEKEENSADGTKKLLYGLKDGNFVEGVLIPGPNRLTLCISTQVGCASGCAFCLTGASGFVRNLYAAEIVNQVFAAEHQAGNRIDNIVLMGIGEPLANYEAVKTFAIIAADRYGFGFSPKKVTISTCGMVPGIERLAEEKVPASLAVSLNAATDDIRNTLMPVNRTWPILRLLSALKTYTDKTGKTVTIEYILIKNINDSTKDAERLADLLEGLPCMVNLLLFNPYPGSAYARPDDERASFFRDMLVRRDIVTVVRRSRGRDISAACGQLRATKSAGNIVRQ